MRESRRACVNASCIIVHTYDYYNYAKKCVINDSRLRGYDTTAINSKDNDDDADDNDD